MIVVTGLLINSWFSLLDGAVIVDGDTIPVYKTDAPVTESGNYILVREESEIEIPIKSTRWTKPVVIIDIVTRFPNSFRSDIADAIDNEINQLYAPDDFNNLPVQSGIQILNVFKLGVNFLKESTRSEYIFRKITRYTHDIFQN